MTPPGNDFERELREALRRKEPSAGFAARVLASLPEQRPSRWSVWVQQPVLRWAAVAVVIVAASTGGLMYREHQQELERGQMAKKQLILALCITGSKLQLAQERVQSIGADHPLAPQQKMEKAQ